MGKSAKLHKRVQNKKTTSPPTPQPKPAPSVQAAKKRADLKSKAKARSATKGVEGGHVLGGADYVTLMLGGRRRAADEALKLPPESS